ncbi:cationic amino acid transporter 2 [Elysia marginata]|uniref:Cationic amino acid transporter 2 n=1 Tax=Elysia marginata TaxID=1093978 RepID=A0AAV4JA53_9GAST|nr:cationic amino acid transporter 2 [Elysia marginata]
MKFPSWVTENFQEGSEKDSLRESSKGGQQTKNYVTIEASHASHTSPTSSGSPFLSSAEPDHQGACDSSGEKEMARCLTTFDVVSLGVGSAVGTGMYLTTGIVASSLAGPAGIFSFALAALASLLSGGHFAKLSSLFPHTSGSAYMYTYATIGEFYAFIIGWGLVVEYMIGTSAAAIALSETIDSLFQGGISAAIEDGLPLFPAFNPVAGVVCLVLTAVLATGVELSAKVNNLLNLLNCLVLLTFVCASLLLGDFRNLTRGRGIRGFFPFGQDGVWKAVPVAYFAFIGFDGLAATGAECKTPAQSIPAGIFLSIVINALTYIAVVLALTIDVNYRIIPENTAMLDVFPIMGYPALKYVLAVGAVSGLLAATFGSLFPLPRVVQAMAQDGLIFKYFSHIHPTRHTAMRATVILGAVSTVIAATVDLKFLIEMVLIGTLLAYVIVTFAVVFIRYVEIDKAGEENTPLTSAHHKYSEMDGEAEHCEFDSSHRATKDALGKHWSKLRHSDSEESDDGVISAHNKSLFITSSVTRPRSRSATDNYDVVQSASTLSVPINSKKIRRHSDNAPPANEDPPEEDIHSHRQIAPFLLSDCGSIRVRRAQHVGFSQAADVFLTETNHRADAVHLFQLVRDMSDTRSTIGASSTW